MKNEARVHLWYEAKFGRFVAPYASVTDAIGTFPTTATAVGIRPSAEGLQLYAPYGISDLLGLVVRPNRKQITRDIYEAKVGRWIAAWPQLTIVGMSNTHDPHTYAEIVSFGAALSFVACSKPQRF